MEATQAKRKVLYVADLASQGTVFSRLDALRRIGQDVVPFDSSAVLASSPLLARLRRRFPIGPLVTGANHALVQAVREHTPDVVWFDKPLVFTPDTLRKIKQTGAKTVCYNQDNPFGPRNDGCWMQFYRIYRLFDLHCLFRKADVNRYQSWDLPYIELQFSYDREQNFPPPAEWTDADRSRGVSFIGSPYDGRGAFLLALAEKYGLPVQVAGPNWQRAFTPAQMEKYLTAGYLSASAYRENIWRSKINLAFVTHSNEDDVAHKAFEITACGAFLLAERTPGHLAAFEEDKEAVFFSSVEECAEKARYYLDHPAEREAIALRGRQRAITSGYDNDTQLKRVFQKLASL